MREDELWVALGLVIFFFVARFLFKRRKGKKTNYFKLAPRINIGQCENNQPCVIQGQLIHGDQVFRTPLSGEACYGYHVSVTRNERYRPVNFGEQQCSNLLIRDGDDYVLVIGRRSLLELTFDWRDNSGPFNRITDHLQRYLVKQGQDDSGFGGGHYHEFREGLLKENDEVAVYGVGRWVGTKNHKMLRRLSKQGIKRVYQMKVNSKVPLCISNRDSAVL